MALGCPRLTVAPPAGNATGRVIRGSTLLQLDWLPPCLLVERLGEHSEPKPEEGCIPLLRARRGRLHSAVWTRRRSRPLRPRNPEGAEAILRRPRTEQRTACCASRPVGPRDRPPWAPWT